MTNYSDDSSDDEQLLIRALPVNDAIPVDLSRPPVCGEEFLKRVR